MGKAERYEQVAGALHKGWSTFTTGASALQTQRASLATVVQDLVAGPVPLKDQASTLREKSLHDQASPVYAHLMGLAIVRL